MSATEMPSSTESMLASTTTADSTAASSIGLIKRVQLTR